ncbi:uncharacterized protein LOC111640378 [Centruroides sculpturatus]|uniref:uncharacterized protein LOC111640378 n=1 Tax=Centruroides sculpturatus TaxID=218467 RepID=UPI000C6E322E|nr:uncharacterized protein LOC111640378 [Centruroides sculpturatus]
MESFQQMLILFSLFFLQHQVESQIKTDCKTVCKVMGNLGKVGGCYCSYMAFHKRASREDFDLYCNCFRRPQDPLCCPQIDILPKVKYSLSNNNQMSKRCTCTEKKVESCCTLRSTDDTINFKREDFDLYCNCFRRPQDPLCCPQIDILPKVKYSLSNK